MKVSGNPSDDSSGGLLVIRGIVPVTIRNTYLQQFLPLSQTVAVLECWFLLLPPLAEICYATVAAALSCIVRALAARFSSQDPDAGCRKECGWEPRH
jgi:hypothetical protein